MIERSDSPGCLRLACGHDALLLPNVDSTNAEALRRARSGARGPLWVLAERQSSGRGREGRVWASEPGNFFATLLMTLDCPSALLPQLSLVAGLAAIEAVCEASGDRLAGHRLTLKWPNDVMLDAAKLAGVLCESLRAGSTGPVVIALGTGINLASHPTNLGRPVTHLSGAGVSVLPQQMLDVLATTTDRWLGRWQNGANFAAVREGWLRYGPRCGDRITIKAGGDVSDKTFTGWFMGLGTDGCLQLADEGGKEHRFNFGDVADPV